MTTSFLHSSFRDSTCTDQDLPGGGAADDLNEFNGIDKIFEGIRSLVPVLSSLPSCCLSLLLPCLRDSLRWEVYSLAPASYTGEVWSAVAEAEALGLIDIEG